MEREREAKAAGEGRARRKEGRKEGRGGSGTEGGEQGKTGHDVEAHGVVVDGDLEDILFANQGCAVEANLFEHLARSRVHLVLALVYLALGKGPGRALAPSCPQPLSVDGTKDQMDSNKVGSELTLDEQAVGERRIQNDATVDGYPHLVL